MYGCFKIKTDLIIQLFDRKGLRFTKQVGIVVYFYRTQKGTYTTTSQSSIRYNSTNLEWSLDNIFVVQKFDEVKAGPKFRRARETDFRLDICYDVDVLKTHNSPTWKMPAGI